MWFIFIVPYVWAAWTVQCTTAHSERINLVARRLCIVACALCPTISMNVSALVASLVASNSNGMRSLMWMSQEMRVDILQNSQNAWWIVEWWFILGRPHLDLPHSPPILYILCSQRHSIVFNYPYNLLFSLLHGFHRVLMFGCLSVTMTTMIDMCGARTDMQPIAPTSTILFAVDFSTFSASSSCVLCCVVSCFSLFIFLPALDSFERKHGIDLNGSESFRKAKRNTTYNSYTFHLSLSKSSA